MKKSGMKKLYAAVIALMVLSFVGTAVLLLFMPDTVPAHYNLAGEVDRYGSKYENLTFPVMNALFGIPFLCLARWRGKKNDALTEKVFLWTDAGLILFFMAEGAYFMIKDIRYDPAVTPTVDLGLWRLAGIFIGILLVLLGNIMPKAPRNASFGLRTKWSMSSDTVWQRSQRFGGFASVACGLVLTVASLLVPKNWCLALLLAVMAAWVAVCVAASYCFYRKAGNK